MEENIPNTLRQLWQLAGADSQDPDPDWDTTFESIGLFLTVPPHHGGYFCTPVNSLEFASTGGDGVHYSLLAVEGVYSDFSPVIMTVPMSMCDTPNLVVGSNLKEFLALGCRFGYFGLEQLVNSCIPIPSLESLRIHYFAHLRESTVHVLEFVAKGDVVGTVGTSGNAAGKAPHLHLRHSSIDPACVAGDAPDTRLEAHVFRRSRSRHRGRLNRGR